MKKKNILCDICGCYVSVSNFDKHKNGKKCKMGGKQIPNPSKKCKYCNQEFSTPTGRGVHEIQCKQNPECRSLNQGRIAWNLGIRSKEDRRNPLYVGKLGGYRENAGKSKKFKVYDSFGNETTLQSTYELAVFEILCELGVNWIRPKALKYNGKNYFADFYLPDFDVWLDPKNDYKAKQDAEKISQVKKENEVKLYIINKADIRKEYIWALIQR